MQELGSFRIFSLAKGLNGKATSEPQTRVTGLKNPSAARSSEPVTAFRARLYSNMIRPRLHSTRGVQPRLLSVTRTKMPQTEATISQTPLAGLVYVLLLFPRLAPWAIFCRPLRGLDSCYENGKGGPAGPWS